MKVPDHIIWPKLSEEQKSIARMWVALNLDVEVRGITENHWVSIHEPGLKKHFINYQTDIEWCIRLKPDESS